jgi:hypothetical protein
MAAKHEPLCDGNHTDRQACNSLLEQQPASPAPAEFPRSVVDSIDKTSRVLEAPPTPRTFTSVEPMTAPTTEVEPRNEEQAPEGGTASRPAMPAPSPWAVRAWEDTAAAVGATATPAPPPRLAPDGDDASGETRPHGAIGHIAVAAGIAGVAAIALVIASRRGR